MLQDDAKLNLAKRVLRRKYTGDKLTAGALENGKVYRIEKFVSGDNFSNVGFVPDECFGPSEKGQTGAVFKATGANPTTWTHLSILRELKVDELKAYQETVFAAASRTVTVTSGAFEGGSGSGELTFEKALLSIALEDLIEDWDPDYSIDHAQEPSGSVVRMS